jgi:hypothetical protein
MKKYYALLGANGYLMQFGRILIYEDSKLARTSGDIYTEKKGVILRVVVFNVTRHLPRIFLLVDSINEDGTYNGRGFEVVNSSIN